MTYPRHAAALAALCLSCVIAVDAKIKVRAEPDPDFDFATVKKWSWDADAGVVVMARTPTDDPAPLKARVDPLIRKYVDGAMAKKGLSQNASAPDVWFRYYVLVTINQSGQYMGQFLPAVPYWGLPPFSPSATSLSVVTKGSLVLDALLPGAPGSRKVVWRGIAESTVADDDSPATRESRLREACEELVKRYPLVKAKKK